MGTKAANMQPRQPSHVGKTVVVAFDLAHAGHDARVA
jgi:hypothetical protein